MLKKIIAGCSLLAFLGLTGCANLNKVDSYPNLTKADTIFVKGESTSKEVREVFGAPTFIAKSKTDGKTIYGFSIDANSFFSNFGANIGKHFATFGFGAKKKPYTVKEVYFKFNEDKVEDIKYIGYAFVQLHRFKYWREAIQTLTEEEYKSPYNYSVDDLFHMYAQKLAKQKCVDISQITDDEIHAETTGMANYQNMCIDGCVRVFNDLVDIVDYKPEPQSYDGTKASLLFDVYE